MILKEVFKMHGLVIGILLVLFTFGACSKAEDDILPPEEETPQPPKEDDDPIATKSDTLELKIGYNLSVSEEELVPTTRSEFGSRDLIGVQIYHLTTHLVSGNRVSYACGVFDDLDKIIFKFVKGNSYLIQMNYYPNAKDFVYNYPDGTFGSPFSDLYGLKSYTVNEPKYFSGVEGGWSGDVGNELPDLISAMIYQPTDDRYVQSFKRGMTPFYLGEIENIKIEENKEIIMPLQLCMMGITLNATNFTEGELNLVAQYIDWKLKPNEEPTLQFQIPYNYLMMNSNEHWYDNPLSGEDIRLFYTTGDGEKFLLATKHLSWKPGVNYVFNFNLEEREDGSIGIQMPSDDTFQNEESFFD